MNITEGLTSLWNSTGIMGFAKTAQDAMANPDLQGMEQILHMHGQWIMILICLFLLWLGIKKQFEPLLLVPIAFGGLIANFPCDHSFQAFVYKVGIDPAIGIFPLIIFMGVGAMTDFGPLIANPKTALLGGAAQFGIFGALLLALCLGFSPSEAGAIGIIGGADGPTSIFVTSRLAEHLLPAIAVAAYSYMALVPVIQPPIMKALTTEAERKIQMTQLREVSKREKITFPIVVLILCAIFLPDACPQDIRVPGLEAGDQVPGHQLAKQDPVHLLAVDSSAVLGLACTWIVADFLPEGLDSFCQLLERDSRLQIE